MTYLKRLAERLKESRPPDAAALLRMDRKRKKEDFQ